MVSEHCITANGGREFRPTCVTGRRTTNSACAVFIMALFLLSVPLNAQKETSMASLVDSNNAFAVAMYNALRQEEGKDELTNLFFSPFSISTAFSMAYEGAKGETAEQMRNVLRFKEGNDVHSDYRALLKTLHSRQKKGECELHIANALWGQQGYGFRPDYLKNLEVNYGSSLKRVDFKQAPEAARGKVNTWVAEQTRDKIKKLMPQGAITPLTRLVLANAVYFKAQWAHTFNEDNTRKRTFALSNDEKIEHPMMHQTERFGYHNTEKIKLLQMPYKGEALSMVLILPHKTGMLNSVENALTSSKLEAWIDGLETTRVQVAVPKFKLEKRFMLNNPLQNMGMRNAFSPDKADFSGMTKADNPGLFIQAAIHKAYVDVYEKGTEAAAATGVSVGITSAPAEKPEKFIADHPFLFLIRDRKTNSILFVGRVFNPAE